MPNADPLLEHYIKSLYEGPIILNILIVDDDKKLLAVLTSILSEEKHNVMTCSNGLEAIDKCRNKAFDLIISDLMMPGASGLEVLKESRKIYPETLVVLVTGYASIETAIQAIREGAYDYITKPFKLEEIKIVVHNAGEKIRLINENKRLLQKLQAAYTELHMMKKTMNAECQKHHPEKGEANINAKDDAPFIAGSMLPLYYSESHKDDASPILSDLERISALKAEGFLSDEEFSLCKLKLFKNINH